MKTLSTLLFCIVAVSFAFAQQKPIKDDCTCVTRDGKTIPLYGKVQVRNNALADFQVQVRDNALADLQVEKMNLFIPSRCGEWQFVDALPDFTIQFVDALPDFTIQFVNSLPGIK